MRPLRRRLAPVLALHLLGVAGTSLVASATAAAATGSWSPAGPPVGPGSGPLPGFLSILAAPSSPTTLYVSSTVFATRSSPFWSSHDGGVTWDFASGLQVGRLDAVDPLQATTVYADDGLEVFKSTDGAVTWSRLTTAVSFVVIAPGAPQIMYSLEVVGAGVPLAVERSDDGGANWRQVGTLATSAYSAVDSALTVSPSDPNTVYAAGARGFSASTDGGATWGEAFVPPLSADDHVQPVIVAPDTAQTLYLAISRLAGETGTSVYRSDDGGADWVAADTGLGPRIRSFAAGASGTLYASTDTGPAGSISILSSANRGASWQPAASGLPNATLTAGPGTPDRLYLTSSASAAILISQDQGKTWAAATRSPSGAAVRQVLVGPRAGGSLLYVSEGITFSAPGESEMWESSDRGATWRMLARIGQALPQLALDARPGVLYSVSGSATEFDPPGISRDDGATWQPFPTPFVPAALATDPEQPGKVVGLDMGPSIDCGYLCFEFTYSLEVTNTSGRGWRLLGSGVRGSVPLVPSFVRLEPGNPARAYAAMNGSLFVPAPGHTLARLPLRWPVADLAVVAGAAASAAPTLYAAVYGPRILWKSGDRGAHWLPAASGLPRSAQPVALAVDPDHPATLYLATAQQVFVSEDAAASWQALAGTGLPAAFALTSLAVSPAPARTLFAGTGGAGVFALTLP